MGVFIRRVQAGDETALAYIQTESWKDAFQNILDKDTLNKNTDIDKATSMYKKLLEENKGNGYILTLDDKPHCIAWWDSARDPDFYGKAELICIHSLPHNRHKGYGSMMMERVLDDIKNAGFSEVILWVFCDNLSARAFYEAKGFCATQHIKHSLGAQEICYSKSFSYKSMNNNISVCGSDCLKCYCFEEKECFGCNNCKGKVFHCANGEECAIYHCCVTKHGYSNCLDCEKIPCDIWQKTRDPKFSDDEFRKNIEERIKLLRG